MATMKIDTLLKKYKLNQKELAESTGINKNTISRYCNGVFEKIDHNHIDLICKYFKCTPNDIFEIDHTVEVTPAKILYYDNETENFSMGEITRNRKVEPSLKPLKPFIWGKTLSVDEPIPSLKDYKTLLGINEEKETPPDLRSNEDIQEIEEASKRFALEQFIDELVFKFINQIMKAFLNSPESDDNIKQITRRYNEYDYFKTGFKIKQYYRIFHPFIHKYYDDIALLATLVKISVIYDNGGLEKLSNEDLKELERLIQYYLNNPWKAKPKKD